MSKYLKLIWFAEKSWTTYHAAVGINAEETICGILRSTRAILPSEKLIKSHPSMIRIEKCLRCLAALKKRHGAEDVEKVQVK